MIIMTRRFIFMVFSLAISYGLRAQTNTFPNSGNVGIGTTSPIAKLHVISNTNSAGDNTVKFAAPMIGNIESHIHWGTTGDWYIRSALQSGKVIIQDYAGGNVGIGTDAPAYKLDVNGPANDWKARFQGPDGYITIGPMNSGWAHIYTDRPNFIFNQNIWSYYGGFSSYNTSDLFFQTNGTTRVTVMNSNGNIGIGTSSPNEKLTVNGTIYGKEVKVDLSVPGPDYVFEKDYNLPSLEEVKAYVEMYKHLPDVPSAKEMEEKGISLGEMNMILLKKMEEMTLYMIELKKENEEIKNRLKMK